MSKGNGNDLITALDNGMRLMEEAAHLPEFSLGQMTRVLDLPTSTVDRVIKTLAARGWLERSGPNWRVGKAAASIWARYQNIQMHAINTARQNLAETHAGGLPGTNPEEWTQ